MPGGNDTCDNSSPSLITNLRRFRFQNQAKPFKTFEISASPENSASSDNFQNSLGIISSTPCSEVGNNLLDNTCSGTEGSEVQEVTHKVIGRNDVVISSSPNILRSSEVLQSRSEKEQAMDKYESYCLKESSLRDFLKQFPNIDIMEAQDLLKSCNWNIADAVKQAQSKDIPEAKKQPKRNASSRGIIYGEDELLDDTQASPSHELTIDTDEDDYNPPNTSTSNANSFYGNNVKPVVEKKKRRRIVCLDDSDDNSSSHGPTLISLSSLNDESDKASKSNQNHSDFSVLNYQPKSNDYLSLKNSQSAKSEAFFGGSINKKQTYKRNAPKIKESSKKKKRKRYDSADEDELEEYGNDDIYDSEDSDQDMETSTPARAAVHSFFQDATAEELSSIPGCSKKKVEAILKCRPFDSWNDLVVKLNSDKLLSGEMLNGAKRVLDMRTAISRLMNKCRRISSEMEGLVEALKGNSQEAYDYVSQQPELLNPSMKLTPYQMLGLNWLLLMHNQEVNGILADEMGLGKTAQAIGFLAYLQEQNVSGPHLIVVPSSTLDNWQNEFALWWPSASIICYHGSQESRRELRLQIINDEVEEFDAMVTTYNMVSSSTEDRNFFKRLEFHYVIFDEAHMLKNMATQRYQHLMRVKASRRMLLTGTPLQNNLVELMSLLIFAMPHMFSGKTEQIKQMFTAVCKNEEGKSQFEKEQIEHAKSIMKPFVLRRLKSEVLRDLPKKHEIVRSCALSDYQSGIYKKLIAEFTEQVKKKEAGEISNSGSGMMMQLRKAANHPLLLRRYYNEDKLLAMAKIIVKEPTHPDANVNYVFEDLCVMSDFELHTFCKKYKSLKSYVLEDEKILDSGKFAVLDELLPDMISKDHRILLFSQFTILLDVVEEYMNIKSYNFLRLDGQVPVAERQDLIDEFNKNPTIPIFLLSTRAGGLGINLTSADTVLIHDIDFNPYNDKQAEDRCHRVGQQKDVTVIRMIAADSIEEGMLQRAKEKLKLERDVTERNGDEEPDTTSVAKLLRDALGLSSAKS